MSARFFQSPDLTNRDRHKVFSAALLVALAVNPAIQDFSTLHDSVDPPPEHKWSSNSVDLLCAREEGQGEPAFVPSLLLPINSSILIDRHALQKVMNAFQKDLSDSEIQELIHKCFPANDFNQHLFNHLRVFLAGKPFLKVSEGRSWLMRRLRAAPSESVETLDAESTVALKHIESVQKWFAVHFRTVVEISSASLQFGCELAETRSGGALVPRFGTDVKDPVYSSFSPDEIKELYAMSDHFLKVCEELEPRIKALKTKLDSDLRKEWSMHAKRLGFNALDCLLPHLLPKRRLYSVTWILGNGPPKFFANHRNEFAELADLLTQYKGATDGPSTQLLRNLRFLGRAMRDLCLTAEDLEPFEEHCKALVAHKFYTAPNCTPMVKLKAV